MQTNGSAPGEPAPAGPERTLERSMGRWMATALVVGNTIGPGVSLLKATGPPPVVAGDGDAR